MLQSNENENIITIENENEPISMILKWWKKMWKEGF
jgi:hypothetical protein